MLLSQGRVLVIGRRGVETTRNGAPRAIQRSCVFSTRSFSTAESRWSSTARLSIRAGPSEPALYTGTIPQHFAETVSLHGDRPAVIARSPIPSSVAASSPSSSPAAPETALTYYDLDILSNRLASSLASMGVRKGDRVAVSLGNNAAFAALTYALFKLGAVLVPLNPTFTAGQVSSALSHLHAEVLIIGAVTDLAYRPGKGRSNEELLRTLMGGNLEANHVQTEVVPSLREIIVVDNRPSHTDVTFKLDRYPCLTRYSELLSSGSPGPVTPSSTLDPSDVVNIQFTSGTTSLPKAAMLSHTSILNNGRFIAHRMGLEPEDRIVVPPPLFHCFGCVLGYMATATTGAAILFPSPAFDPVATVRMCAAHDATGLYGVSTMFVAVLEALEADLAAAAVEGSKITTSQVQPKSLRKGIAAGSSVPPSVMQKVQAKLGLRDLVICYGMTETSPVSCMTSPSDSFEHRTTSVGTVMPHTTVKIVSPRDRSVIVPLGEPGELAASGYLTMKGYFDDPVKTAEVRVEEEDPAGGGEKKVWVYSGDEACMDEQGFVQITGRIKDLIIRGGENIHPLEVEDCLFQHPGIQEVSVAGVTDSRLGEAVAAFVIPKKGWTTAESGQVADSVVSKDNVRSWVREKLSGHLVPKHVFWVEEYPKTASGKIQKFKLREMGEKLISSEGQE